VDAALTGIVKRRATEVVASLLPAEPVIAVQGPRTVGKSTLMQRIATDQDVDVFDLDDVATRDAVRADPATYAASDPPVCFDEYQKAPAVLEAIKAELNKRLEPGRFLLAGSTTQDALPELAESLTGRLHTVELLPLSQGEIRQVRENFIEHFFDSPQELVAAAAASSTERAEYIDLVVAGGFPIALRRAPNARGRWFDDYVRQTLERDVRDLSRIRQREQLRRLLERLAGQTAQLLNIANVASELRMEASTAENYTRLLETVYLIHRLPAWGKTLRARAVATPKIHVVDSGVAARLLRLTPSRLARLDPTSQQQFGHLLETFAVNEVIKQSSWLADIVGHGHWRTHDDREADIVLEREDGAIAAFEIKGRARVPGDEFAGLRILRDAVGDAFVGGAVLYLGRRSYTYEDRLHAMPLDRIWIQT
jgi:uncharacterized protein